MTEYLMHAIEREPKEAYPMVKQGQEVKVITGDPWFDDLEEKVSRGEDVTLTDFLSAEVAKNFEEQSETAPAYIIEPIKDEY